MDILNKNMDWKQIFDVLRKNGYLFTRTIVNFKSEKLETVEVETYWQDCFLNSKILDKKIFFGAGTTLNFVKNFNELIMLGEF